MQARHLQAKLDDIAAAAGRMGRKDWALWVSAALLGAFVQGILPPEVVQHIIRLTVDGLAPSSAASRLRCSRLGRS